MTLDDPSGEPGRRSAQVRPSDETTGHLLLRDVTRVPGPRGSVPGLHPCAKQQLRPMVQVVLCEDQEVFRLGLRAVFEAQPDIAVVAETADLVQALEAADGPATPVVVVRQRLVGGSTLPLLRDQCRRGTGVLLLAETRGCRTGLIDVLQAGVRGCLPRRAAAQPLVDAIRALARHEVALDSTVTGQLVRHLTDEAAQTVAEEPILDRLTERQRQVAELVAQGLSNEEIAGRLFLSPATIKSHLAAVMRRLDVRTRTQLAILVAQDRSPAA
jgi:DNA-binding NarL/FixJ family response regulator